MAQISRGLDLGDPDATTQGEIIERNKRKREEETTTANLFTGIQLDKEAEKQVLIFLHADKNANHPEVINEVRARMMDQFLNAKKNKK